MELCRWEMTAQARYNNGRNPANNQKALRHHRHHHRLPCAPLQCFSPPQILCQIGRLSYVSAPLRVWPLVWSRDSAPFFISRPQRPWAVVDPVVEYYFIPLKALIPTPFLSHLSRSSHSSTLHTPRLRHSFSTRRLAPPATYFCAKPDVETLFNLWYEKIPNEAYCGAYQVSVSCTPKFGWPALVLKNPLMTY